MRLLVLGAGFSGRAIAEAFGEAGFAVAGTTRSQEKADTLSARGIEAILYDGETISDALRG